MSNKENNEKKNILQLYAIFGAALVLGVVPNATAAVLSLVFGVAVLATAYMTRAKVEAGSLSENHMTFIIRTIWIGTLFSAITMLIGSVYLFFNVDSMPMQPCANDILDQSASLTDAAQLKALAAPCMESYLAVNQTVFLTTGAIVAVPVLVYFVVRYARGLSRALRGYRIAKPLHWF